MKLLDEGLSWYRGLQQRERLLVLGASLMIAFTLFFLIIWEPVHKNLEEQSQRYQAQLGVLQWMQNAADEVRRLKATGDRNRVTRSDQPDTLIVENSAATAGIKAYLSRLESTSDKGARVTIDAASFDQLLLWLNTLQTRHGITVRSANMDRDDTPGGVNARLTLNRE